MRRACAGEASWRPASFTGRWLLLALALVPILFPAASSRAGNDVTIGLQRWGSGEFRRFGLLVYEATLWAGNDPQRPPLALRLDYKRSIEGAQIAMASVTEMRRFVADESRLQHWGDQMRAIFPDVKPGDHIVGRHVGDGVRFYQNERLLGTIDSRDFADNFFAIWLDARTGAPALRAALLRPRDG